MFDSVEKVRQGLADQSYICDAKIATVVFLANRQIGRASCRERV